MKVLKNDKRGVLKVGDDIELIAIHEGWIFIKWVTGGYVAGYRCEELMGFVDPKELLIEAMKL